jgi:hypothetical protein
LRRRAVLDESETDGFGGGLAAGSNVELPQDRRDMVVYRFLGHDETLGDLCVA